MKASGDKRMFLKVKIKVLKIFFSPSSQLTFTLFNLSGIYRLVLRIFIIRKKCEEKRVGHSLNGKIKLLF